MKLPALPTCHSQGLLLPWAWKGCFGLACGAPRVLILFIILLGWTVGALDAQNNFQIGHLPRVVRQGDVFLVRAEGPTSLKSIYGEFRGKQFPMSFRPYDATYVGLVGIDMEFRPTRYEIKVVATDGAGKVYADALSLKVEKVDFGIQRLSLPPSMVDLDAKSLERAKKESLQLKTLFEGYRDERLWRGPFISPVKGELSGAFGIGRIINGKRRSPHTGVDLRAEEGAPVCASNGGVVVLVDELFFAGKSVILDHGCGLYSMYFHLSEVLVKGGDRVSKGAILGRVGSTGRSTGPHLHWGIKMNGARVDPLSLLGLTEHLKP
jgi:murein DD-endopeptidase MepM/ murein hydrolase activator NlpD